MDGNTPPGQARAMPRWPLALIASPAAVAVWSGWVGLGGLCGFGEIHPLPGIWDSFQLNTAITLPIGIESYGAYALAAWVTSTGKRVREFARRSAIGALGLGMAGQVAYHLLAAGHAKAAPWWVTTLVSCLPVATLALATALTHLQRADTAPAIRPGSQPDSRHRAGWPPSASGPPILTAPYPGAAPSGNPAPLTAADGPPRHNSADVRRPGRDLGQVETAALAELSANPDLSGAELARRLGVGERRGQRLVNRLAPHLSGTR